MGAIVSFNYATFRVRYPEFANVDEALVALYFAEATIYHRNDGSSPVTNPVQQAVLLNMLTAHICQLNAPVPGAQDNIGSPQLVGAITSANEGSVSVSTQLNLPPGTAQWFTQTKYGLAYWNATVAFRTMQYSPKLGRNASPFYPLWPR